LGDLYSLIPNLTIQQAAILACKKGGDFREAEKHITNWVKQEIKSNNSIGTGQKEITVIHMHHNFGDVFSQLVNKFI